MYLTSRKGRGLSRQPFCFLHFIFCFCVATTLWLSGAHADNLAVRFLGVTAEFDGATGGIVRFPNDLEPKNDGNVFGEGWGKFAVQLARTERAKTSLFVLGNVVADSHGFSYNNTSKIGVGLSHSVQVSDALNVTFSGRHDWYRQRDTDVRRSGIRLAVDYYYYQRWEVQPGASAFGSPKTATVLKSYGSLQYPGSLQKGDNNLVVTFGGELSMDLDLPETEWILSPFADIDVSWDKDRHNYNNKLVPGLGLKARYPLVKGEIFAGIRLSGDYRPIDGTFRTGPALFLGWYKGF